MAKIRIASVGGLVTLASCYSWGSWNSSEDHRPQYDSPRQVQVATQGVLQATFDGGSVRVSLVDAPLCRDAQLGRMIVHEERTGKPSALAWLGWEAASLGVMAAGGALIAAGTDTLLPGSFILGAGLSGIIVFTPLGHPLYLSDRVYQSRDTLGERTSQWSGEVAACPTGAPVGARASVLLSARFPRASDGIEWKSDTDDAGQAVFTVRNQIDGIASYCGTATVVITESRSDPGTDDGTPEAPAMRHVPAKSLELAPSTQGTSIDRLSGLAKRLAQECRTEQLEKCVRKMTSDEIDKFQMACDEECAGKVDALECVFARRTCLKEARPYTSDQQICTNGYRECLLDEDVTPDSLEGCAAHCIERKKNEACP